MIIIIIIMVMVNIIINYILPIAKDYNTMVIVVALVVLALEIIIIDFKKADDFI